MNGIELANAIHRLPSACAEYAGLKGQRWGDVVEVLALVLKSETSAWLDAIGKAE